MLSLAATGRKVNLTILVGATISTLAAGGHWSRLPILLGAGADQPAFLLSVTKWGLVPTHALVRDRAIRRYTPIHAKRAMF